MNIEQWAFAILHFVALFGALFTLFVLFTPAPTQPSTPGRTPPVNAQASASQKLLMLACINAALISFIILLPALVYRFNLALSATALCWTQGLMLQYLFVAQHTIMLTISLHTWLLLVKWEFNAAEKYRRVYFSLMVGVPLLVLVACVITAGCMHTKNYRNQASIGPREAYCFWNGPSWFRLLAYSAWYVIATIPGAVLSIWVVIYLFRTRHAQRRAFQSTSTTTAPESCKNAKSYKKLYQSISKSIIYRTAGFAVLYTAGAVMSFTPSLVRHITEAINDTNNDSTASNEHRHLDVEFTTAAAGIGLFLVFGTGSHARLVIKDFWQRWIKRVHVEHLQDF